MINSFLFHGKCYAILCFPVFIPFVCCEFVNFERFDLNFIFFWVVMRVGEVFVRESDDSTCWLGDMLISIKIR
jgi:hypothetical protein